MSENNSPPQNGQHFNFDSRLPKPESVAPAISGQNGSDHAIKVGCEIARRVLGDYDLFTQWMWAWNEFCEPPWSQAEMEHKIHDSWKFVYDEAKEESRDSLLRAKKGKLSVRAIDRIARDSHGKYQKMLSDIAQCRIPPLEELIDYLYPGNPLLCRAAGRQWWVAIGPREDIRGVEHEFEWLVPSPMSKRVGFNMEGQKSIRCRDCAGPRVYIVLDFDLSETAGLKPYIEKWAKRGISIWDVQAAIIEHLALEGIPRQWPFMIVNTGGKSLHSWYHINVNFPEATALEFLSRGITLGADKRAEQPEQLFRFPGGTRKSEHNQPQPVIFYDPVKILR